MPTNVLLPGQSLTSGQSLVSPSGRYQLEYQSSDGNLVLKDLSAQPPRPIWDFGTNNTNPGSVTLGTDSNLVVRDPFGTFLKGTHQFYGTPLAPAINAVVQDDGNFVIYSVWATFNTTALAPSPVPVPGPGPARGSQLTVSNVVNSIVDAAGVVQAISAVVSL